MTTFMQTFIAMAGAVAMDRFFKQVPLVSTITQWRIRSSYDLYVKVLASKLEGTPAWKGLPKALLLILPLPLIFAFLNWMFNSGVLSILGIALGAVVLFLCLDTSERENESTEKFVQIHEGLFAPLFWYFLLGPFGALVYTLLSIVIDEDDMDNSLISILETIHGILAWVPARLTAMFFGLVGQFNPCYEAFERTAFEKRISSRAVLTQCGGASMSDSDSFGAFFDRTIIFWFVVYLFFSLL